MTVPPGSLIKAPKVVRAKGRARPDVPLAAWCQVGVDGQCTGRADQRHHRLRRSQGGTDDESNTADVCGACHGYVHAHPTWAYANGWLVHGGSG